MVYIFGTNFSPDPTQVAVRFGSYPCNLKAESSSVNMLTCITSPATNSNSLYGLALTVSIQGQTPLTCSSSNCQFSYSPWKTPIVHELVPKTVAGGDLLNVFGLHRITDTGDGRSAGVGQVTSMLINGYSCSLIDVVQSESINPDYRDNIICRVFSGDEAGEYYFAETVSTGLANSSLRLVQTSPTTGNSYHVRVAAEITQDFPHSGGHNGHRLALTLSSEAADVDKYTCTVAGQTCSVSSVDTVTHKAYVEIPAYDVANVDFGALPKSVDDTLPQQSPFLGSNGFRYKRYSLDLWMGLEEWATYLRGPNITLEVLQDEAIYTELGSAETHEDRAFVEHLHGYLWVPKTGLYNFYALADDQLLVKLAKLPSNSHPDNLETIIQG